MARKFQTMQFSFNGGEVARSFEGRVDAAKYRNSCRVLENMIPMTQGGARRRPGTRYINDAATSSGNVRLIPFVYSTETAYILEVVSGKILFYKDGARIETGGSPVEVNTPYGEGDIFSLQYAQSADVLYLVHPDHPPAKLIRLTADGLTWSYNTISFLPPPTLEDDQTMSFNVALQAISGSGQKIVTRTASSFLAADVDRNIKYLGSRAIITSVTSGTEVVADIPSGESFPSALISTGPSSLSSTGTTVTSTGHGLAVNNWIVLTSGPQAGEMRYVTVVDTADQVTINAAFTADQTSVSWNKSVEIAAASWTFTGSPSTLASFDKISPVRSIVTITLTDAGWRSSDVGRYVKALNGIIRLTEIISITVMKGEILSELTWAAALPATAPSGSWTVEEESWSADNGYPRTVSFYEQRLGFGGSERQPQTIWMSRTGDYENFGVGVNADHSVEYTIVDNQAASILWMYPSRVLLVGTNTGEYRVSGGGGLPISPSSIEVRGETKYGSSDLRSVPIGESVLFVQRTRKKLRELVYSFDTDAYSAKDLTVLNPDICSPGVKDMAYCLDPYALVFVVRDDGVLLALSLEPSEEVAGWARLVTGKRSATDYDKVLSIATIPNVGTEELWLSVKRKIDGVWVQYIEQVDWTLNTDCSVTASGTGLTTLSGLDHLIGEDVDLVGDTAYYGSVTVPGSGTIDVDPAADEVEAGLHYEGILTPVPIEGYSSDETIQGLMKSVSKIYIRMYESGGIRVNGDVLVFRPQDGVMDAAVDRFTGDYEVTGWGHSLVPTFTIESIEPIPAMILAVIARVAVGV